MKAIKFNTEMVQAIIDGRKTQTRRVVKVDLSNAEFDINDKDYIYIEDEYGESHHLLEYSPYKIGNILYVRETWQDMSDNEGDYIYFADGQKGLDNNEWGCLYFKDVKWRPSIHMPKEAARIFLKVTDVRIARLWDMDAEDAIKEGCDECSEEEFAQIWDGIYLKKGYGWAVNPWVWVYTFERTKV